MSRSNIRFIEAKAIFYPPQFGTKFLSATMKYIKCTASFYLFCYFSSDTSNTKHSFSKLLELLWLQSFVSFVTVINMRDQKCWFKIPKNMYVYTAEKQSKLIGLSSIQMKHMLY